MGGCGGFTAVDITLLGDEEFMAAEQTKVVMYATMYCPFCMRAKQLLGAKQVAIEEIDVDRTVGARQEMMQRSNGGRTVPQIFIGDVHVGGCDELFALERNGRLDALLNAAV
jgi:glutaredoxin 3